MTKDHKLGVKIGGVSMIPSYIYMSVLQFLLLFGCTSIIGIELPSKGKIYFLDSSWFDCNLFWSGRLFSLSVLHRINGYYQFVTRKEINQF